MTRHEDTPREATGFTSARSVPRMVAVARSGDPGRRDGGVSLAGAPIVTGDERVA